MTPSPTRPPHARGVLVALLALVATACIALGPAPAAVAIPRCPTGTLPPCDPDGPPDIGPPSVDPGDPGLPSAGAWAVQVRLLDQADTPLENVTAERFWADPSFDGPSSRKAPLEVPPLPGGSASLDAAGRLRFGPEGERPPGGEAVLRLTDSSASGVLCRTRPHRVLTDGAPLHILTAPRVTLGAEELGDLASGFTRTVKIDENTTVTITSATLDVTDTRLELSLEGTVVSGAVKLAFTADQPIAVVPSDDLDSTSVGLVTTPVAGEVDLRYLSTPPAEAAQILDGARPVFRDRLATAIRNEGSAAVDAAISGMPDVRFWTDQGFSVSLRRIGVTPEGLNVDAAFCRLG